MEYSEKILNRDFVLNNIKTLIKNEYPEIEHISLFGSYARNTMGPLSDIDLIIEKPANIKPMKMWALSGDLMQLLKKPIDIMRLDDVDYNSEFYKDIEETKIDVFK